MTNSSIEFAAEADCAKYLLAKIPEGTLSKDIRAALASGLASQFKAPAPERSEGGFAVIVSRWIIRDDDLKAYEEFVKAITAAAGATFFFDNTKVAAAAVGVAVAVFSVFRNARKSSAFLSDDELVILLAIGKDASKRPHIDELIQRLAGQETSYGSSWGKENVHQILHRLEKYPTRSGLKKFVACDAEGKWSLEGL